MKRLILIYCALLVVFVALSQDTIRSYDLFLPQEQVKDLSISYDGSHLVLLTQSGAVYKLYEYVRDNGTVWSDPRLIYTSEKTLQGPSYAPDDNRIYLSINDKADFDIYYIDRTLEGWTAPKIMDSALITTRDELSPWVGPLGRTIYFVRDEGEKQRCTHIFYSEWTHGHWTEPKKIVAPINLGCEDYARMEIDGKNMFFISYREGSKSFDIFYTKKITQGIYTIPQRFSFCHNRKDELSPTFDPLLNALVFVQVTKRENKIYNVRLASQYSPSPVVILRGKVVDKQNGSPLAAVISILNPITNSPVSQFEVRTGRYQVIFSEQDNYTLKVNGKGLSTSFYNYKVSGKIDKTQIDTLDFRLFSYVNFYLNVYDKLIYDRLDVNIDVEDSLRHKGLGKTEIREVDKGKYLVRLPIGSFYKFDISKENYNSAIFSLDLRVPILYQDLEKDIDLEPRLQRVVLKVVDAFNQRGIETDVEVVGKKSGSHFRTKVKTDAQGNVVLFLKKGDVYEISITPKGYTFFSQELSLDGDSVSENKPPEIVAKVKPLEKNLKMQFHNITFELNSADLREEAYPILNQLVKFLKQNPGIKVEISAHTDDLGSEKYNLKLSLRRANAVVEYLKEHGISADRMIAIGYGESRPLVPNDSDEHRAMNRRVEFKILEIK